MSIAVPWPAATARRVAQPARGRRTAQDLAAVVEECAFQATLAGLSLQACGWVERDGHDRAGAALRAIGSDCRALAGCMRSVAQAADPAAAMVPLAGAGAVPDLVRALDGALLDVEASVRAAAATPVRQAVLAQLGAARAALAVQAGALLEVVPRFPGRAAGRSGPDGGVAHGHCPH